ncbi:DUF86 domain-containing protein [Venenivibrio stagnispumantis]|uniref:Uncharacterized conserved protein, contains HEPN domain n=1 Tax=Venenivibrio stagnispumantis TaxID=407998 RepID=A0AA46AEZ4_9AQUI|nr:DUF86 domain-containing protein [Venenivibrio stagnispumantis]MCW4573717.1 DUF86 domain-containing protein [Venenivibrio stagnispumantis]SMP16032.1 Uncharacterized conserved protein, contains HEPN domain [Venenivibrio stagnispumantis]
MKKYYQDYINDILEECTYLINRSKNLSFSEFEKNEDLRRAFIRSLEIIGEAVKKLPEEIKEKNKNIPWKEIAGMRDKLIHDYFGVDYEIIWLTVNEDIPFLKKELEKICF